MTVNIYGKMFYLVTKIILIWLIINPYLRAVDYKEDVRQLAPISENHYRWSSLYSAELDIFTNGN